MVGTNSCYETALAIFGTSISMYDWKKKISPPDLHIHGVSEGEADPKGFEPPTNRTGICHSIQLNYGSGRAQK